MGTLASSEDLAFTPDGKQAYMATTYYSRGFHGAVTPVDTVASTAGTPVTAGESAGPVVIAP